MGPSQILLYDRTSDPSDPREHPRRTYRRDALPESFAKKFRYASRFVDLVRSKTPKIVFYSPQAKCILMENSPLADFEIMFYNNTRAHYSVSKETVEIKVPRGSGDMEKYQIRLPGLAALGSGGGDPIDVPSELAPIVRHIQECLKQCMDVERSGKLNSSTHYPIILKSSHCRVVSTSGGGGGEGVGGRNNSPREKDSFHPSQMSTYTRSATGTHRSPPGRQPVEHDGMVGSSSQRGTDRNVGRWREQPVATDASSTSRPVSSDDRMLRAGVDTRSRRAGTLSAATSTVGDRPTSAPVRSAASDLLPARTRYGAATSSAAGAMGGPDDTSTFNKSSSASAMVPNLNFHHLPDVGWCVKTTDGKFVMLFDDGVRNVVDPRDQTLEWIAGRQDEVQRFTIDRHLPDHAKAKLAFFPRFLRLAGLGAGQSRTNPPSCDQPAPVNKATRSSSSSVRSGASAR
ncbi:Serine/threonine-protein kinase plk4 [Thoreauomyces humboldtii]|nr:Serine/threonine-protein kinase plk4 [Thoreauomyces humboldtii]